MPNFHFSNRTNWSLHHNPLSDSLETLKSQGIKFIDLTESNPTRCGFRYPENWLKVLAQTESLSYIPVSKGMLHAREAIVQYYKDKNISVNPENLVLTSSTSEGYSFVLKLITNPGDRVLIPKPSYPLFQFLLELADVEFDYYPLVYDKGWHIDKQAFKDLIKPNTKAVIVVNPNNPTGSYVGEMDRVFLNEECLKHSMAIISDEVFLDYKLMSPPNVLIGGPESGFPIKAFGNDSVHNPQSMAINDKVLTFVLSGVSKILALPQMKLSWILTCGPTKAVSEALERLETIADTYLSVNTPVQNALATWLSQAEHIQGQVLERVKSNLAILQKTSLNVMALQGGWYACLHIPSIRDEEAFVLDLLEQQKVLVHPGYFFDFDHSGHLVLSLLPETQEFQEAIDKIISIVV